MAQVDRDHMKHEGSTRHSRRPPVSVKADYEFSFIIHLGKYNANIILLPVNSSSINNWKPGPKALHFPFFMIYRDENFYAFPAWFLKHYLPKRKQL